VCVKLVKLKQDTDNRTI